MQSMLGDLTKETNKEQKSIDFLFFNLGEVFGALGEPRSNDFVLQGVDVEMEVRRG